MSNVASPELIRVLIAQNEHALWRLRLEPADPDERARWAAHRAELERQLAMFREHQRMIEL